MLLENGEMTPHRRVLSGTVSVSCPSRYSGDTIAGPLFSGTPGRSGTHTQERFVFCSATAIDSWLAFVRCSGASALLDLDAPDAQLLPARSSKLDAAGPRFVHYQIGASDITGQI